MNFFFSITICKNFFTKISLCRNLSAQNDVTTRPDPLILLTVFDDWRYHLLCIAHGMWADYHLIDNELNQFPVWPNHALPSALGTDHLILVEELGQFILSLNLLFSASLFAKKFFTKISLCRNFFYHSMLFYYTKKKNPCEQSGLNQY